MITHQVHCRGQLVSGIVVPSYSADPSLLHHFLRWMPANLATLLCCCHPRRHTLGRCRTVGRLCRCWHPKDGFLWTHRRLGRLMKVLLKNNNRSYHQRYKAHWSQKQKNSNHTIKALSMHSHQWVPLPPRMAEECSNALSAPSGPYHVWASQNKQLTFEQQRPSSS